MQYILVLNFIAWESDILYSTLQILQYFGDEWKEDMSLLCHTRSFSFEWNMYKPMTCAIYYWITYSECVENDVVSTHMDLHCTGLRDRHVNDVFKPGQYSTMWYYRTMILYGLILYDMVILYDTLILYAMMILYDIMILYDTVILYDIILYGMMILHDRTMTRWYYITLYNTDTTWHNDTISHCDTMDNTSTTWHNYWLTCHYMTWWISDTITIWDNDHIILYNTTIQYIKIQ